MVVNLKRALTGASAMSTEEGKPTGQETQQPSSEQAAQATTQQVETQTQPTQQAQQIPEQAVAKPEVKEVKLPRPRVSLSGKLRQLLRLRLLMKRREPRWMRMDEWRYLRVAHGEHWRRPGAMIIRLGSRLRDTRRGLRLVMESRGSSGTYTQVVSSL